MENDSVFDKVKSFFIQNKVEKPITKPAEKQLQVYVNDLTLLVGDISSSTLQSNNQQIKIRVNESISKTALKELEEILKSSEKKSDIHFAILHCCGTLWSQRKREPWVIKEIERLSLKDIDLVEKHSDIIFIQKDMYAYVPAFKDLIALYEKEGYIEDALKIAEKAMKLNQNYLKNKYEELSLKVKRLHEEDMF